MSFEPSLARRGLDLLLAHAPHLELVDAEWQRDGPWLLVTLGQPSTGKTPTVPAFALHHYAIWQHTGAVHGMSDGAVTDDAILLPA